MRKKISFEVDQKTMLKILKVDNGRLYRWSLGFFCVIPQPASYEFGDAPAAEWIGTVAFQQMVGQGLLTPQGELAPENNQAFDRSRPGISPI